MADVARAAGVFSATVSYVLSGKRAVTPETRTAVEAAIAGLGFVGRQLASHRAADGGRGGGRGAGGGARGGLPRSPLAPGRRHVTPVSGAMHATGGFGAVSRAFHSYVRRHVLPRPDELRPVLRNSWEATGSRPPRRVS